MTFIYLLHVNLKSWKHFKVTFAWAEILVSKLHLICHLSQREVGGTLLLNCIWQLKYLQKMNGSQNSWNGRKWSWETGSSPAFPPLLTLKVASQCWRTLAMVEQIAEGGRVFRNWAEAQCTGWILLLHIISAQFSWCFFWSHLTSVYSLHRGGWGEGQDGRT